MKLAEPLYNIQGVEGATPLRKKSRSLRVDTCPNILAVSLNSVGWWSLLISIHTLHTSWSYVKSSACFYRQYALAPSRERAPRYDQNTGYHDSFAPVKPLLSSWGITFFAAYVHGWPVIQSVLPTYGYTTPYVCVYNMYHVHNDTPDRYPPLRCAVRVKLVLWCGRCVRFIFVPVQFCFRFCFERVCACKEGGTKGDTYSRTAHVCMFQRLNRWPQILYSM